jgi:hypothetical protein
LTFKNSEDAQVFCVEKKIAGIHCRVYPLTLRNVAKGVRR